MSQLRLNPLTGRWVVIAIDRAARPGDLISPHLPVEADPDRPCPFCPGNEEATPPALETYGKQGEWVVRIVPNRYPAFDGDEPLQVHNLGPVFTQADGSGIHEILVFSPEHSAGWADLDRCANCGRPLGGRRFELQAARELSRWLRKGERDQPPSTPPRSTSRSRRS